MEDNMVLPDGTKIQFIKVSDIVVRIRFSKKPMNWWKHKMEDNMALPDGTKIQFLNDASCGE